jgi:RNA polymerase sigma-70 factor (ECF subfamily)
MNDGADPLYEQLLVLRCQTGDELAFREVVDLYGSKLSFYVRKLLREADGVDDVLQNVWLDVIRQLPRLRDPAAFTHWLYRIARGQAMLAARRRGPAPEPTENTELLVDENEPVFSPEDAAAIHLALDRLPPAQSEVLVLRFLEELSYEEISKIVGCPTGTVRSRIHYAKVGLKRILDHHFGS